MKIALCDVDGHNFPNLPLMKLSALHKQRGDRVEWWVPSQPYDVAYVSKVFTFTPDIAYMPRADKVFFGGTGYGLDGSLPCEVEHIMPDYSLYPQHSEAYGFLTRGCPRACSFCIVSEKEGRKSVQVADLSEFHDGQKEIKLLDPNLTACADREKLFGQLADSGAWVDFTQGLDIRLMDRDCISLLNRIKTKLIHFAWDDPKEDLTEHFLRYARHSKIKDKRRRIVYVLVNFNSTHEEDLHRIYTLKELGFYPFVMVYGKEAAPDLAKDLARWVNRRRIFAACDRFEQYDRKLG